MVGASDSEDSIGIKATNFINTVQRIWATQILPDVEHNIYTRFNTACSYKIKDPYLVIKLKDYLRIHGIITALLDNEDAKTERACLYYASYGAYILHKHFNLDAVAVSGAATYHLGDSENILFFGDIDANFVVSHDKAFHAWVEVAEYLIDFMAPTFNRITGSKRGQVTYPARMLQKPLVSMKEGPDDLDRPGDFFLLPNIELTRSHASFMTSKPVHGDLAEISIRWFRKTPRKIHPEIGVQDQRGKMQQVQYKEAKLSGVW